MELWTPVRAHAEWITLFRETLYGRAALTPWMIADDRACEVGRWLEAHERTLGHLREFQIAQDVHASFHRRAAYCLRLANAGRRSEALADTGDGGQLRRLSQRLVTAFQDLKRAVRQKQLPVTWSVDALGA